MALVAPGIGRFSINGTLSGEECVAVLDVHIDTEGGGVTRSDALFSIAGDILNNWTDHIMARLTGAYEAQSVSWVDLNSADGSTGSRSETDDNTWPQIGARAVAPLPNSTYAKIVKVLEHKTRQQRNGTLRLSGIAEADTSGGNGNLLESAAQTALNDAFEDFKDGVNGENIISGLTANLAVVHTVDQEFTSFSEIATFQAASVVGTIRRRMPGYGS